METHSERRRLADRQHQHYRRLDAERKEIRLLVVEAASDHEPIRCALHHVYLLDEPKPLYETVSYVWGDASLRATIFLHGHETDVPASSERVLRRMRHADASRTVWIDAICINQEDTEERGQQVSIMYEIYSNTSRNLVWLGEDDGYTAQAIDAMDILMEEMRRETNDFASFDEVLYPGGESARAQCGFSDLLDADALFHFLSSPFFERLWIVQEVTLATESICYRGNLEIPLQTVLRVASWMNYKWLFVPPTDFAPSLSPVMLLAEWADREHGIYVRIGPGRGRLLNLLESLREFKCQDPRDHVFGLLGLHQKFSPDALLNLVPDYTASLVDVLTQATMRTIEGRQDLACLHFLSHGSTDRLDDELPTWVPRFDKAFEVGKEAVDFNLPWTNVMACGGRTQWAGSDEEISRILPAKGFIVDVVEAVIETFNDASGLDDVHQFFERMKPLCIATSALQPYSRGEIALTVVGGATNFRVALDEDSVLPLYEAYTSFLHTHRTGPPYAIMSNPSPDGTSAEAITFQTSMKHACFKRCFFRTELGYIGLGPQIMQPGDYVAVLHGCRWPVTVRRVGSSTSDCSLLGICYINRIMTGEAVEALEEQGGDDLVFRIH